jgi:hypothetical protein
LEPDRCGDGVENPVLIPVREAVEKREGMKCRTTRHELVRLRVLDECPHRRWNASDHWTAFYLELGRVLEDGT